jgi:hypothetical protein
MYDHGHKTHTHHDSGHSKSAVKEAERRCATRHTITTGADVVELHSGARFSSRTTDLSTGGCFIDTTNPFPVGSKLRMKLNKGQSSFETPGTVVYSQTGLGMGIAFDELKSEQQHALAEWLSEVTGERIPTAEIVQPPRKAEDFRQHAPSAAMVRLVRMLIGKGMLTEAEGTSVLHEPVL